MVLEEKKGGVYYRRSVIYLKNLFVGINILQLSWSPFPVLQPLFSSFGFRKRPIKKVSKNVVEH